MHTTLTSHTYIHDKTLEGSGKEKEGKTSAQHVEMNKVKSSCESLKKEEKSPGEKSIEAKECKTCVKQFKSPCIYINHYREEHGSVPPEYSNKALFFCEKCSNAYLSRKQLTEHIRKVHLKRGKNENLKDKKSPGEKSINAVECKTCAIQFRYPGIYINHYRVKHGSLPPEYRNEDLVFCEKCSRAFLSKAFLADHNNKVHCLEEEKILKRKLNAKKKKPKLNESIGQETIECKLCPMKYTKPNVYINHYQESHGSVPPEYENEDLFICELCSKRFLSVEILRQHKRAVHIRSNNQYKRNKKRDEYVDSINCSLCEETFSAENTYIRHYESKVIYKGVLTVVWMQLSEELDSLGQPLLVTLFLYFKF